MADATKTDIAQLYIATHSALIRALHNLFRLKGLTELQEDSMTLILKAAETHGIDTETLIRAFKDEEVKRLTEAACEYEKASTAVPSPDDLEKWVKLGGGNAPY